MRLSEWNRQKEFAINCVTAQNLNSFGRNAAEAKMTNQECLKHQKSTEKVENKQKTIVNCNYQMNVHSLNLE